MEAWWHIEVLNHGSVEVLRPLSDEAREWVAEHVGEAKYSSLDNWRQPTIGAKSRSFLATMQE